MAFRFDVSTRSKTEFQDITAHVQKAITESGVRDGVCYVYVPHTTAGITINENADPSVRRDIMDMLDRLVPAQANYTHLEGNSPAHIKASLMGASATIPIENGRLALGTWQGIFLCEFDGPRRRKVLVQVIG
ncbi:MAG: secondary thiamine-phosphate synthase enzyme YjbQ [Anaerolineae bacterium]